jgi:transposase
MLLKTILNRVEPCKSFVYKTARFEDTPTGFEIEVPVEPRTNGRAICSGCGQHASGYDRLPARRFEFVPLWNIAVFLVYAMRRVNCPTCGIVVERVPWSGGKSPVTKSYQWFLAKWAERLAWSQVASIFHTSWNQVRNAVKYAVLWGVVHQELDDVKTIGIDEIARRKGHNYLTVVYQIDAGLKRLLWVGEHRQAESLRRFFASLTDSVRSGIQYVCSDMWKAYLQVIAEQIPQAVHVLDRFHVMAMFNRAIDQIRAEEARQLKRDGYEPLLKHSRWCLLKRRENLTDQQTVKLRELLQYNLRSVKAYLQREDFQRFWEYRSPAWASNFLRDWCSRAKRTRIEPLVKLANTLLTHEQLLVNWFRAEGAISAGSVEGLNGKAKLAFRKAYGFRDVETAEIALFHQLGKLPEPILTHKYC